MNWLRLVTKNFRSSKSCAASKRRLGFEEQARTPMGRALAMERLEERVLLATYNWTGYDETGGTVSLEDAISAATNGFTEAGTINVMNDITDDPHKISSTDNACAWIEGDIKTQYLLLAINGNGYTISSGGTSGRFLVMLDPCAITMTNLTISGYKVTHSGNIYISGGSVLALSNVHFTGCENTATSGTDIHGGVFYVPNGRISADNCTFTNCKTAKGLGGVAAIDGPGSTNVANEFNNCTFTNCSAKQGGAFYIAGGITNFTGTCQFNTCSCTGSYGGAVYSNGATTSFTGTSFDSCSSASIGGAIFDVGAPVLKGCSFTSCSSTAGGAVFAQQNMTVEGCSFTSNKVTATRGGGAILMNEDTTAALTLTSYNGVSCSFKDNNVAVSGGFGGAIRTELHLTAILSAYTAPHPKLGHTMEAAARSMLTALIRATDR